MAPLKGHISNGMKILVIAPTPFFTDRGTHIRILEEALALERLGHTVTIATYHIGSNLPPKLAKKIDVRRILRLLFWYKKLEAGPDWQKIILDVMLIRKTFFLARTLRPDILHGHLHEGALIGWIVQKFLFWRRMKLVCDFHGSLTKEMVSHDYLKDGFLRRFFRFIETRIDNLGDAAITSSWENTAEIKTIRQDTSVGTILDGVNLAYYQSLPTKEAARREFDLPLDKVLITYTGALIANKGIHSFLEVIPIVLERYSNAHIVIGGYPLDQIEYFFNDKPWRDRVTFISPLSYFKLPLILHASDIGVDPKETTTAQASGKALQYMGAGLPVACFDTRNNREYLGEGAELASEISAKGLAEAISCLINDKDLRERRGRIARERAEQFSWDAPARKLEGIYRSILER